VSVAVVFCSMIYAVHGYIASITIVELSNEGIAPPSPHLALFPGLPIFYFWLVLINGSRKAAKKGRSENHVSDIGWT